MKKFNCSLMLSLFVILFSVNAQAQCPTSCSTDLTDCSGVGSGCVSASCSGNLKVPNFQWSKSGTTVSLIALAVCYIPGGTPPWSTNNVAGRLMNLSLRPSATRTFNCTASNGSTFKCTVESNGLWSVQLISGTAPGGGTNLSGGSYTL